MLLDHSSEHYTRNEFLWWNLDDFSWHLGKTTTTTTTACKRMSRHEYNKSYGAWICFCSYFVFSMHFKDGMQLCKRRNHLFIGLPSVCSFCFCHCISSRMKFKSRTHCTMTGTHTSECMCMFYGIVCLLVFQSWDSLYVLNAIKNGKTSEIPHFDGFTVVVPR